MKKSEDRLEQFIRECAEHWAVRYEEECYHLVRACESPIEKLLMAALIHESKDQPFTQIIFETDEFPDSPPFDEAAFIYNQVKIGTYRADFAIWDASLPFEISLPRIWKDPTACAEEIIGELARDDNWRNRGK